MRYQVKFRRRREGKTDYRQRKRLVTQDKNKYNSPRHRFVVRMTNTDIVCQIVEAKIDGDKVLAAAYSHELKDFEMPVGLTNYAAAYATGLLAARRVLKTVGLDQKYAGNSTVTGEYFKVERLEESRPFLALLDVGLRRTTTGSRVFAALKGAVDGGVLIPHNEKRFVGFDLAEKKHHPDILRKHIFAGHVSDYMKLLKEQDPTKFDRQFAEYVKAGLNPNDLESRWAKVHKLIRANPDPKKSKKEKPQKQKSFKKRKLTLAQRKDRAKQKLATLAKKQKLEAPQETQEETAPTDD